MPHEKINFLPAGVRPAPDAPQDSTLGEAPRKQLVVEWNRTGWTDIAIYPDGWKDTGYAWRVALPPQDLDLLIKTLKRAKRQAYGAGQRFPGYEDIEPHDTESLFRKPTTEEVREAMRTVTVEWERLNEEGLRKQVEKEVDSSVTLSPAWGHDRDGEIRKSLFPVISDVYGAEVLTAEGYPSPEEICDVLQSKGVPPEVAGAWVYPEGRSARVSVAELAMGTESDAPDPLTPPLREGDGDEVAYLS